MQFKQTPRLLDITGDRALQILQLPIDAFLRNVRVLIGLLEARYEFVMCAWMGVSDTMSNGASVIRKP
jgi:hypothetical protein